MESIIEMMGNPYCDHLMYMELLERRDDIDDKINEIEASNE
jgi:hypothetical protein